MLSVKNWNRSSESKEMPDDKIFYWGVSISAMTSLGAFAVGLIVSFSFSNWTYILLWLALVIVTSSLAYSLLNKFEFDLDIKHLLGQLLLILAGFAFFLGGITFLLLQEKLSLIDWFSWLIAIAITVIAEFFIHYKGIKAIRKSNSS